MKKQILTLVVAIAFISFATVGMIQKSKLKHITPHTIEMLEAKQRVHTNAIIMLIFMSLFISINSREDKK